MLSKVRSNLAVETGAQARSVASRRRALGCRSPLRWAAT